MLTLEPAITNYMDIPDDYFNYSLLSKVPDKLESSHFESSINSIELVQCLFKLLYKFNEYNFKVSEFNIFNYTIKGNVENEDKCSFVIKIFKKTDSISIIEFQYRTGEYFLFNKFFTKIYKAFVDI